MNLFFRLFLGGILSLTLTAGTGQAADQPGTPGPWSLTILHVNDTHSHLEPTRQSVQLDLDPGPDRRPVGLNLDMGGFPLLLAKIKSVRTTHPEALLLHGGDTIQGSLFFAAYQGVADFDFLNLMKFDAMTVGNHEFDRGPKFLASLIEQADFPVLGANVDVTREPNLEGKIKPFVITRVGDRDVALVGLVTPETKDIASPGNKITFHRAKESLAQVIGQLDKESVTAVVVLSHLGYEEDLQLAREIEGVDVIVGGHSHTLLGDFSDLGLISQGPYPSLEKDPAGNTVCIAQGWSWGRLLGQMEVQFDGQGRVTACSGYPTILSDGQYELEDVTRKDQPDGASEAPRVKPDDGVIKAALEGTPGLELVIPDPEGQTRLDKYAANINLFKNQPVAQAAQDLNQSRYPGSPRTDAPDTPWPHAFPMNQICADSLLWAARNQGWGHVDFAYLNNGGVRQGLKAGNITAGQLYDTFFFDNTLVLLDIGGREILADLENGIGSAAEKPNRIKGEGGGFPTLSGARFSVDMNRPSGARIISIDIRDEQGQWVPLDPDRTYRIATLSFTANGGEGYQNCKNASGFRRDTGVIGYLNLIEYARHLKNLVPPKDNSLVLFIPEKN